MQIIPVIDLMKGAVVHARRGLRDSYRPVQSPLCRDASPWAVIDALLGLSDFDTLYVADLDALMGVGDQRELLNRLQQDYPDLTFWIDRGLPALAATDNRSNCVPVIGSESLSGEDLARLPELAGEFILSLDFMAEHLLGGNSLLQNTSVWPEKIIIMSLSRVGGDEGPDFQRLESFRASWPDKKFVAGGGVRDEGDLERLQGLGISGVLLASALHSGALNAEVLREYG